MGVDLGMAAALSDVDLVHSHTWYANLAGHVGGLLNGIPHVATTHSLEPLRPWKAEQLGGGYRLSSWCERVGLEGAAKVIAVSRGMRADVLECYPAGGSRTSRGDLQRHRSRPPTSLTRPPTCLAASASIAGRPYVVFVGRVTRQKGLPVLLKAAADFRPEAQLVLLAGAADTPELGAEVDGLVSKLRATRTGVIWVDEMLPRPGVAQVLSHAAAFICPSVYEPLGIVNLEAMACQTAVVASAVGGIPEVVEDGVTGILVPAL